MKVVVTIDLAFFHSSSFNTVKNLSTGSRVKLSKVYRIFKQLKNEFNNFEFWKKKYSSIDKVSKVFDHNRLDEFNIGSHNNRLLALKIADSFAVFFDYLHIVFAKADSEHF